MHFMQKGHIWQQLAWLCVCFCRINKFPSLVEQNRAVDPNGAQRSLCLWGAALPPLKL